MAALDEAGADLRDDEPFALEDAERVAAEPYEQRRDRVVGAQRVEQRIDDDPVVGALVRRGRRAA